MSDLSERAMQAVHLVSERMAGASDIGGTIGSILSILNDSLGYGSGMVTLLDERSEGLLVEAVHGISSDRYKDVRYRKGEGLTGLILETKAPLAIPLVKNDPRFVNKLSIYPPGVAFVGAPIQVNGDARGAFSVSVHASERFRLDEHVRIASTFANLIGAVFTRLIDAEKEKENIRREKRRLESQLRTVYRPENMIGVSKKMEEVFDAIDQTAKWNVTALIRGESGTGKELVAKAIHYRSPRSGGPFVKLNCAAVPDSLLESELFGHEKGAFTGAAAAKPGRFELADKGTLFLDEIGDTTPAFQAKLLRVLQEGQFERLGGTQTLTVDVRLIAATNVDLEEAVAKNRFREDLYYRLNVMPIYLPPLRERREDIPHLVYFFLEKLGGEAGRSISMSQEAMALLCKCDFPGNVRELENCVRRSAVKSSGEVIRAEDVPCHFSQCGGRLIRTKMAEAFPRGQGADEDAQGGPGEILSIENERDRILAALKKAGWTQAKAARMLNMTPRQIGYRIAKLNIDLENY
ncbi:MAG: nif-specific transcriptional activator NifA [Candidatus Nitrospinota bacterium M3_3B_026]